MKSQQTSTTSASGSNLFAMMISQKQQQQQTQPSTFGLTPATFQAQPSQPQPSFFNQPQTSQFQPASSSFFQQPQQQQEMNSFQNNFFKQTQQTPSQSPFTNIAQPQQMPSKFVHPSFGAPAAFGTQMSTTQPFGQFSAQTNTQSAQMNQNSTQPASGFFSSISTNGGATSANLNIYSSVNELSSQDVQEYQSNTFVIGRIPHEPPPKEFCE